MSDYKICPLCNHTLAHCYCLNPNISTAILKTQRVVEEADDPFFIRFLEWVLGGRRK